MLILILGSESGFGDDFGQYDTKTIILRHRNSVAMATLKIPSDKNYLKGCVTYQN